MDASTGVIQESSPGVVAKASWMVIVVVEVRTIVD